jgi:ribonuclease BN (tRNA processing enzyme)
MRLQFVGSGDAFGSGGRFNTCLHVTGGGADFLIDCGASSPVAMQRLEVDRNAIDLILLTHFHADHCGGVPFFMLDAQLISRRTRPLVIAGPPPLKERFPRLMDTAFAGSSRIARNFELSLVELPPEQTWRFGNVEILPFAVLHGVPPENYYGYRIAIDGKVLAFSGDTAWTDSLIGLGRDADLFVCESYGYDKEVPYHLAYRRLLDKLPLIRPKRLIITHMSEDMLARRGAVDHEAADDGLTVEI